MGNFIGSNFRVFNAEFSEPIVSIPQICCTNSSLSSVQSEPSSILSCNWADSFEKNLWLCFCHVDLGQLPRFKIPSSDKPVTLVNNSKY